MVGISYPGHQPALRRRHPAAAPGRHHAAVGHRRHLPRHALPRRHPQHRLRRPWATERNEQAAPTARAGRSRWSTTATPPARPTRCCACRTPTARADHRQPLLPDEIGDRHPALFADEIDVPVFLAGAWQDEQTGGHWPGDDRRLHVLAARLRHAHQRHAHRVAEPRRVRAGTPTSSTSTSATACRRRRSLRRAGPGPVAHRRRGAQPPAGRLQRVSYRQALRTYEAPEAGADPVRGGRRRGQPPARRCRASRSPSRRGRSSGQGHGVVPHAVRRSPASPSRLSRARSRHAATAPARGAAETTTPARARPSGRPTRRTTGSRSRRAPAWAGSARG